MREFARFGTKARELKLENEEITNLIDKIFEDRVSFKRDCIDEFRYIEYLLTPIFRRVVSRKTPDDLNVDGKNIILYDETGCTGNE